MNSRSIFLHASALLALIAVGPVYAAMPSPEPSMDMPHHHGQMPGPRPSNALDPASQPQFVNPLKIPPTLDAKRDGGKDGTLKIRMEQVSEDLGVFDPGTGHHLMTTVWGYNGTYPGPTIEARVNETVHVDWINHLPTTHLFP